MIENINIFQKIANFIANNFLFVFGIYSIIFFLFRNFKQNKIEVNEFDKSAIQLTIWTATIWIILKLLGLCLSLYQLKIDAKTEAFSQHLYWFVENLWFQLLFWIILSQALRIEFMKNHLIPRIIISFFFAFSFERITMIIANNYHRDYLPNGQSMDMNIPEIGIGMIIKTLVFILIVSIYYFWKRRIKNALQQRV